MNTAQLTFTRFLAAMAIVIFHYGKKVFPFNDDATSFVFSKAYIGVSYFFILSGFVMVVAYTGRPKIHAGAFLKNRAGRILPGYLLSILLLYLYYKIHDHGYKSDELWLNVLLVQAWVPGKALAFNYPGWSLVVEAFFYLLFPLLFNQFYRKGNWKKAVLPILVIWVITQIGFNWAVSSEYYTGFPSKLHDFLYYFPVMHLNEFLVGNLLGMVFLAKRGDTPRNHDWLVLLAFIGVLVALKFPFGLNFHDGLMAIFFAPIILFLALGKGSLTVVFSKKPFIFLGEISYGIYIFQHPASLWCLELFKTLEIKNPEARFWLLVAVLVVFSALVFVLLERPIREWVKRPKHSPG